MARLNGSPGHVAFPRLWLATTASGLATWALPFVLGLAVVDGTLDGAQLGVALAARTVGFLVALPVAGVLADRHSARAVAGWSCGTAALATLPLAVSGPEGGAFYVASFVIGAGQGACRPAFQALVPAVVPENRRQEANAAISVAVRGWVLLGPALASLAAVAAGYRWVLAGVAVLWLVAAIVPSRPVSHVRPTRSAGLVGDYVEGLREVRRHPWFLAGLGALAAVIATGYSVTAVVLPLVSDSAAQLAAATTAFTVGALLGGLLMARWRPRSSGWTALAGLGLYALAPLVLALELETGYVVSAYLLVGVGIEVFNVPWFTAAQREVPADRLSRVTSFDFLVSYGLAPVGLALVAPAVDAWGSRTVLLVAAVVCGLGPALAALVPSSRDFARPGPDLVRPEGDLG